MSIKKIEKEEDQPKKHAEFSKKKVEILKEALAHPTLHLPLKVSKALADALLYIEKH